MMNARTSFILTSVALCTGFAHAGVTEMTIRYASDLEPLLMYDINMDSTVIGDENFDVSGGAELLNFSASAAGGDVFQSLPWGAVSANASGGLTSGGFTHDVNLIGSAGGFFDIPDSADAGVSSTITFTIDEAMEFALIVNSYFFNNDAGFSSFGLTNLDTNEQFVEFPFFVGDVFTGMLEAGTYQLSAATNYGGAGYSFNLVPAPSTIMMLGLGGVVVTRRSRQTH